MTTTTHTTTPWLEALKWVGCFVHQGKQELVSRNTLPRPLGYTSIACTRICRPSAYTLLGSGGVCHCAQTQPAVPEFKEVPISECGAVCATEEMLLPKRHCGGNHTFAVYKTESVEEVRASIGDTDSAVWPAWASKVRGVSLLTGKKNTRDVIKGISYGPVPLKKQGHLPDDDFMSESTEALWGSAKGRHDLGIMKALGANTVRLYGDDPRLDHLAFLDEALKQGLEVIVGLSDYPYTQMPGNCLSTGSDCYEQVKSQYLQNLKKGFLTAGNTYHPALRTVILMNEPDLKFPEGPRSYCKALVSAFDAALDAEKEVGVAGLAPAFTATFSFGVCPGCAAYGTKPALGQMIDLRSAMKRPETVGYTPRNDIWAAYRARFINSVNTANPATDIRWLFLNDYDTVFRDVPVFIGEYHSPRTVDQKRDLETVLSIAEDKSTMLIGVSFFEYQVRYDKGGSEMTFGMFGLEERSVADFEIDFKEFKAFCLTPMEQAKIAGHMYRNKCGSVEFGVDFVSDSSWATPMDHIPTPEFCCNQCAKNPKCKSWTWVEDAGLTSPGSPSQCWLKGGLPVGKVPKDGVISGIPGAETPKQEGLLVQNRWGQCGGQFWKGPTSCEADWECKERSEFYHQCTPPSKVVQLGSPGEIPNIYVHQSVAAAYGGPGVSAADLCPQATTTVTATTTTRTETSTTSIAASTTQTSLTATSTTTTLATAVVLTAIPLPGIYGATTMTTTATTPTSASATSVAVTQALLTTLGATTTLSPAVTAQQVTVPEVMPENLVAPPGPVWHGCFKQSLAASRIYSNEQGGFSSAECIEGCSDYHFALLHNGGHCSCGSHDPRQSKFVLTEEDSCGEVCPGEMLLAPKRYCGGPATFAVYRVRANEDTLVKAFVRLE